ncbi:MAG: DNA methyltransferase [Victivallaceae bacterium]
MALSWNEIKRRAIEFAREWKNESREDAEAKSFWDAFFEVFGISRRRVAAFERPVDRIGQGQGYIDLFWKGTLIVEHKSRGKDLDKAYSQALDYFNGLKECELPQYVLVSDFERFRLYDLEENKQYNFQLKDFHRHIHLFSFVAGYASRNYQPEAPINIKAAELMGKLHDRLAQSGYTGHKLEVFLVRILFALFADDTGIFEKNIFADYIEQRTAPDGSDLGMHLARLFEILNTPEDRRNINLDEALQAFPYVNGKLFEENLPFADFNSDMRAAMLECCYFNWSLISPAIFGSMFQSVMDREKRRNLGAHYTSEQNILKLIKSLFLDDLKREFAVIAGKRNNRKQLLEEFHDKLASLKFFDPACGCGNFLVITYRELRLLEIEIIKELYNDSVLDIGFFCKINVDQMYGIEIEEFPARIAGVALWLVDHQMNQRLSEEFGMYYVRLPLRKAAKIIHGNALRLDWNYLMHGTYFDASADIVNVSIVKEAPEHYETLNVLAKKMNIVDEDEIQKQRNMHQTKFDYILGNPPFIGKHLQNDSQKADADLIFHKVSSAGLLDYVACWYVKAAQYIQNTQIKVGFVSTNSITQGEQVGILWNELLNTYHVKIHFAHRTFQWNSEARGMAHVHVVIIGFACFDTDSKTIFDYEDNQNTAHQIKAANINPYLAAAPDVIISSRSRPVCRIPKMDYGSKPVDDGNLILSDEEKIALLNSEPQAEPYIRPLLSAKEFLHDTKRWCLWLINISPHDLRQMPLVLERINKVKNFRLQSRKIPTQKDAETPSLFAEIRQPDSTYILVPRHSSENRKYIPIGFFDKEYIVSDSCQAIPDATLYHFGVLTSVMHMTWVKHVCGRLKSDYRYSKDIVYNSFPWPKEPGGGLVAAVEEKAQAVLDARNHFPECSLADLYDPVTMPPVLVKAHNELDKAVDKCYRGQAFGSEMDRLEYLFQLYLEYTAPLV